MHKMTLYLPALKRLAADQRGVTAIVTGIALLVIMGFGGLAIDVAYWLNATRNMQAAADQSAYSAAAAAGTDGCASTAARPQAIAIAAARGYPIAGTPTTAGDTMTLTDGTTTLSIKCTTSNSHFTVKVEQRQPMWFANLFMPTAPMASAFAKAQLASVASDLCILALDGTNVSEGVTGSDASAFWTNGNASVNVKCGVAVDSSNIAALSTGGTSSLTATNFYLVGDNQGSPSGSSSITAAGCSTCTPVIPPNVIRRNQIPVADPYAGRTIPPYSCGSYTMTEHITGPLTNPTGVRTFCGGLTLGSGSGGHTVIDVAPGVYIIARGQLIIHGQKDGINGHADGVTFILTGDGTDYAAVTVNGSTGGNPNRGLQLTAPTSGPYAGLVFFQDRRAPSPTTMGGTSSCGGGSGGQNQINGGSKQLITGALYFPSQSVCYGGGSATSGAGKCVQLIAHSLSFTGTSDVESNCAGVGIAPMTLLTPQLIQ